MGDSTIEKIDRFFNVVDATLDEAAALVNRTKRTGGVVDAAKARYAAEPATSKGEPSTAIRPRVRIIESTDALTGANVFVVTDGVARSECSTRELAERVRIAMESAR